MTADEIRGLVVELKMKVPRDAALVLLAEIAAQLAESNALFALQLQELRKGRVLKLDMVSPSYPCSVCSLVFYSDGALKSHFSDAHEGKR
jgi:hypothetical protein